MEERLLREVQISSSWWFEKKEITPAYRRKLFSDILKGYMSLTITDVKGRGQTERN